MSLRTQIIMAPSILGLRPSGVERLADTLLSAGLNNLADSAGPVFVHDLNQYYDAERDLVTQCLNPSLIFDYSVSLGEQVNKTTEAGFFPIVLGGDCSILIGIMAGLKSRGRYGLVFMDAHADFYLPEESPTGEVADMDLAIVTGEGSGKTHWHQRLFAVCN